jgi:type IV pilus assembly protein PilN
MIKINLLPRKVQREIATHDLLLFCVMLVITLLISGGIYAKNSYDISSMTRDITNKRKEIDSLQGIYKEYMSIEKEKKEINRRIGIIDGIKEGRALPARLMYDLPGLLKDSVWLKRFKKDDMRFELEGRSMESESISEFTERLAKIPYIRNVELKSVEDSTEDGITVKKFTLNGEIAP